MSIRAGYLPSPTWNRLGVNYAVITEDLTTDAAARSADAENSLPEGLSFALLPHEEVQDWLSRTAPAQPQEAVVAGKKPMYHPQAFGTGLGAEFDEVLEQNAAPVQLLEAAPGTKLQEPLVWNLDLSDGERISQEQLIHVGAGAELTLLLTCRAEASASGTALISTKIVLEPQARLHLVKTQMLGNGFLFLDDTGAALREDAQLQMTQIELGAGRGCIGVQPELVGDRSSFDVRLYYLGTGARKLDFNYNAVHRGRRTQSHLSFEGVMAGSSQKTLRDTIDFRHGSAGSKGREEENVLVLSDDIVNRSMPIILCEEEDVEGSHGASIGRMDEDVLFYLASRGIGEREAVRMMVRAKLAAVSADLPDEALRRELIERAEEEFEQ